MVTTINESVLVKIFTSLDSKYHLFPPATAKTYFQLCHFNWRHE